MGSPGGLGDICARGCGRPRRPSVRGSGTGRDRQGSRRCSGSTRSRSTSASERRCVPRLDEEPGVAELLLDSGDPRRHDRSGECHGFQDHEGKRIRPAGAHEHRRGGDLGCWVVDLADQLQVRLGDLPTSAGPQPIQRQIASSIGVLRRGRRVDEDVESLALVGTSAADDARFGRRSRSDRRPAGADRRRPPASAGVGRCPPACAVASASTRPADREQPTSVSPRRRIRLLGRRCLSEGCRQSRAPLALLVAVEHSGHAEA